MIETISIKNRQHVRILLRLLPLLLVFAFLAMACAFTAEAQIVSTEKVEERQKGIELYRQGKFEEAKKQLRKAVAKHKTDAEAWHYLGLALLHHEQDIKDASMAFENALALQPDFAVARVGLGYAYLASNRLVDAMREAQTVLANGSKVPDAYYIAGTVHLRSGEPETALKEADEAIKLNPQLAGSYFLKSLALVSIYSNIGLGSSQAKPVPSSQLTAVERAERRKELIQALASLGEAAESLEMYLKLNPSDPSADTWRKQLQTLKVYASHREHEVKTGEAIFFGIDVTTKPRVLAKPEPMYTKDAQPARVNGTVVLRAVFAADGSVRHILIVNGLPFGLTERAIEAARKIRFVPATMDGRPVSMFIQLEYHFDLYRDAPLITPIAPVLIPSRDLMRPNDDDRIN